MGRGGQRCECGEPFRRMERTSPGGTTYAVTGCPTCLDSDGTAEALDALADAAVKHADALAARTQGDTGGTS